MSEVIAYKPVEERTPDSQYRDILNRIYHEGRIVQPIQGEEAKMVLGAQMHYDLSNGFPVINERKISEGMMRSAIGELVAFINGAHTQEQLEEFGVKWWDRWLTAEQCAKFDLPEGEMGAGSYGSAWTHFPTAEGGYFNQITHLMRQLRERPFLRTHILSPWVPQYTLQHAELQRNVVVAPCHGYVHIAAFPDTQELSLHHFQRSGDLPVGVPFNMIQYAALGMMVGKLMGYRFTEYVHTFSDVHMYESQYEKVKLMLDREPRALGTVALVGADDIVDIRDFRPEHFELHDYNPHPALSMPTPV